jgi:hypothetical protein
MAFLPELCGNCSARSCCCRTWPPGGAAGRRTATSSSPTSTPWSSSRWASAGVPARATGAFRARTRRRRPRTAVGRDRRRAASLRRPGRGPALHRAGLHGRAHGAAALRAAQLLRRRGGRLRGDAGRTRPRRPGPGHAHGVDPARRHRQGYLGARHRAGARRDLARHARQPEPGRGARERGLLARRRQPVLDRPLRRARRGPGAPAAGHGHQFVRALQLRRRGRGHRLHRLAGGGAQRAVPGRRAAARGRRPGRTGGADAGAAVANHRYGAHRLPAADPAGARARGLVCARPALERHLAGHQRHRPAPTPADRRSRRAP